MSIGKGTSLVEDVNVTRGTVQRSEFLSNLDNAMAVEFSQKGGQKAKRLKQTDLKKIPRAAGSHQPNAQQ